MHIIALTKRSSISNYYRNDKGKWIKRKLSKAEVEERYSAKEKLFKGRSYPRAISYDFLGDAAYIYFVDPDKYPTGKVHTVTVHNGVNCDFYKGQVVGIEILWVTDHIEFWLKQHATETPKKHYNILSADPKAKKLAPISKTIEGVKFGLQKNSRSPNV